MILDGNQPHKFSTMPNTIKASQLINSQLHHTSNQEHRRKFPHFCGSQSSLLIACFLGLSLMTVGCGSSPKESADAQSQGPSTARQGGGATPVDVAIARTENLQTAPEYTGTTTPFRTVSLRSQVEGRLLALNLDVGDRVKQGQNIGQLDDVLLLTDLKQAEAELASLKSEVARATNQVSNARAEVERARLELLQAQADSQRQQQLVKQGAIAEQTAQQARTAAQTAAQALRAATEQVRTEQQAVAAAQGRVVAQQAVVAQAKERRSYSRLTSPITGVVTEKVTEPGNLLQAGGEVLKIADFNQIKVVVQVSELELAQIRVGQSVQVRLDAFPNQTLTGRVTRISPTADATARLIPVEVVIANREGKIGSGLLARVNFATQAAQRVVVPQTAIQKQATNSASSQPKTSKQESDNQTGTLFVVTNVEGKAQVAARSVTLGKRSDGKVEILSGLQPGDRYVVRSGKPLKDGDAVRLSIISEKS
ncbi:MULTISPECIES: efflux RND transporter periplasmic adaptor subunit [unclassified Tolypothrix]|uniref:efflux RND transporter periplasmic adaptor subunit n=2 Tax=unclassified Tolypothrix TaxID=2649714 RepID=UPI0005F82B5B|nr:efflux RND transporter periplasmic adaptor subunit [Tolypothrix sp. LEGE 11397]UYD25746.1 efflux RND transporter periplasmic adaptor subunit [Tolypothrix sp. PCC 7712]UYD32013.1 efflux RND transporter periplasmic adaptor subunit [Tolypothrix sp. PCC 7601]BAY91731.1 RND family efflux transporter MFP subunit [Microchaete diplosiphon NIES-3275]